MNSQKPNESKPELNFFYREMKIHRRRTLNLLKADGQITDPFIRGHVESHLEKIEDSIAEMESVFELEKSNAAIPDHPNVPLHKGKKVTQRQSMRMLLSNMRYLLMRMKRISRKNPKVNEKGRRRLWISIRRRLQNDTTRTAYMMQ